MTMLDATAAPLGAVARAIVLLKSRRRPPGVIDVRTLLCHKCDSQLWHHFNSLR